jgi:hypothetical protein
MTQLDMVSISDISAPFAELETDHIWPGIHCCRMWYCTNVRSSMRSGVGGLFANYFSYYLWQINHTYDTSWTGFNLFVWALLECHLAIIFACAPSLRAFLRRYLGEAISRTFRSGSYNRSAGSKGRSHNGSTLRNSNAYVDAEIGKAISTIDQHVIEKPSQEAMGMEFRTVGSGGARSSFTITNPDEYEAYSMRQLSKHGYLKRHTNSDLSHDWNDTKPKQDPVRRFVSARRGYHANRFSSILGLMMDRPSICTTVICQ